MRNELLLFDVGQEIGEVANCQLPDPNLFDYYKRLKNREIYITTGIDDCIVEYTQQIIEWNREYKENGNDKPIRIWINSNGGSLNAIMELITVCKLSKVPIIGIGMGKCLSAGGLLLMGLPKGNRYVLQTTEILIHDGANGFSGDTGKVLDDFEYTKRVELNVKNFVLDNTKITPEEYDKNYRRNWWMFAEDAIKYGIADHIVTDIDEIL